MWKEKLKLFATNLRILIYIVLAAAIAFGAVFVWNKYNLQQVVVDMSDATIAVLGTLLGAIVGGLFTLIGTNYLHRKTLKAQTEIKKINVKMIGLDLKSDVIKKCNEKKIKYIKKNNKKVLMKKY